jgi:hypothetical protein
MYLLAICTSVQFIYPFPISSFKELKEFMKMGDLRSRIDVVPARSRFAYREAQWDLLLCW